MTTKKNVGKYLWITAVAFITYLLLGSFIVCKDITELLYLVILYLSIIFIRIKK